jgi:hypothetical protein
MDKCGDVDPAPLKPSAFDSREAPSTQCLACPVLLPIAFAKAHNATSLPFSMYLLKSFQFKDFFSFLFFFMVHGSTWLCIVNVFIIWLKYSLFHYLHKMGLNYPNLSCISSIVFSVRCKDDSVALGSENMGITGSLVPEVEALLTDSVELLVMDEASLAGSMTLRLVIVERQRGL